MRRRAIAGILTLCLVFAAGACRAASADGDFAQAMQLFGALDYEKAEPMLLKLVASGALADNELVKARESLATIYVASGDAKRSAEQFALLVKRFPGYAPAADVSPKLKKAYDQALADLETERQRRIAAEEAARRKAAEAQARAEAARRDRVIGYSLLGAGLGTMALGGGGFYGLAINKNNQYQDEDDADTAKQLRSTGQTYELLGQASLGVGAVVAGVGIYFLSKASKLEAGGSAATRFFGGLTADGRRLGCCLGAAFP